ncbi:MAG: hypothetical protein NVV63_12655 [Opitutus sp.]|nr:hypothetical protein [Opitutus sp.]
MSALSSQQEEALDAVRRILAANFDCWALSFRFTREDLSSVVDHDWHGNVTDVVGLTRIASLRAEREVFPPVVIVQPPRGEGGA